VLKYSNVAEIERGVQLHEFRESMDARDLDAEFRLVRKLTETKEHLQNQEAFDKKKSSQLNRYAELKPFKHTRVRLPQRNEDPYDSYINANYINSSTIRNDQLFIATQGPLESTVENFWRMVDHEKVSLIVMLTHTKEHNKVKCHQYWPAEIEEGIVFDKNKEMSLISIESLMPNLIKRKMALRILDSKGKASKTRVVTQLQYLSWPDHGAPDEQDYSIVEKILDTVREHHRESVDEEGGHPAAAQEVANKILTHCSAGIGRTGTLIAIYNL